ncbi:protein NDUFAF4 homolog [Liolophura sinensis]|uniref:protein NDUFAF4 homolog n=1 Tax=Liolophura sinensis TaxID=3198878 RepID=UPI0031584591
MGKVMSTVTKPIRNFNVENRAMRAMDRQAKAPKAAPRHETTKKSYEQLARENPELQEAVKSKNEALHERLLHVRVESTGPPPDQSLVSRSLPLTREKSEDPEFGYLIPDVIPEGRVSLKQVFEFIGKHQNDPKGYTAQMIADEYKLELNQVQDILRHFQAFHMYVPKKIRDKMVTASSEEIELMARPPRVFGDEKETEKLEAETVPPTANPEPKP